MVHEVDRALNTAALHGMRRLGAGRAGELQHGGVLPTGACRLLHALPAAGQRVRGACTLLGAVIWHHRSPCNRVLSAAWPLLHAMRQAVSAPFVPA